MRTKSNLSLGQATRLGGPPAGTAWAVGVGREAEGYTLFLGSAVGIYRASDVNDAAEVDWQRLPSAPIGVISLAVSPRFTQDHTLLAGTNTGVFVSRDAGDSWHAGQTPLAGSVVNALSFSPGYENDGSLLGGTLEDGALFTNTRGATWLSRNFGLVDAAVFAIGFSPNFANDFTAFAGTDTAVYYTYNGVRAWKLAAFPENAAPAMCLAVSPGFAHDRTVFVGTEAAGLYRSTDAGDSWESLGLPTAAVNALLFTPGGALLAATEAGLFRSDDAGANWNSVLDQPDVLSLAASGGLAVAGLAGQGAWFSTDLLNWTPAGNLSAHPVIGLALPAVFEDEGVALMYGPSEGIWCTVDGGASWQDVNDDLPSLDIRAAVLSPNFAADHLAAAASDAGVLLSTDGGLHWNTVVNEPADWVAFSPNGRRLAASFAGAEIRATDDLGQTWQRVKGDWPLGGRVAALAVGNTGQFYVAVVEGMGEILSLWQGQPGEFEKVHSQSVGENPVVAFWVPAEPTADRPWYAALGAEVLKISSRKGRKPAAVTVIAEGDASENLLMITGVQDQGEQALLAATGRRVYKSTDGQTWSMVHDFGSDRAVTVSVSPNYLKDKTLYALLIGGTLARLIVR